MDSFELKSKVTGKRQITIPKEICDLLSIEPGEQVVFQKEGDKIVFKKHTEYMKCFVCNGHINEKCFICNGTGFIEKNPYKIVSSISQKSILHKIGLQFIQHTMDQSGSLKFLDYPIVKLFSNSLPEDELLRIQDEIQKLFIEYLTPKSVSDDTLFCCPSDSLLESILNNLSTTKAKEEVRRWFRYERSIMGNKES